MKKLVYTSILFVFVFISNLNAQQRNVIWVHGLGDDETCWAHYEQIFSNELNINSLRESYGTGNGITPAAYQVINSINSHYGYTQANNPNNLAIGHSMGGLMIRETDRVLNGSSKKIGGYITVTTPNYGAPIANSLLDGSVTNAAQDACNKISDGPLSELLPLPWTIVTNLTTDVLCDSFIDNDLISSLQGSPTTNEDLKDGSPKIDAINNYNLNINQNIPRISIWAEENSPVHWRMISSDLYDNDQTFVNYVNLARAAYNGFYIYNTTMAIVTGVAGFWNPWLWGLTATYTYRATQWKKGRNWIDDSENIWSALIKTTRSEQIQVYELVYVPDDDYDDCVAYAGDDYWPGDCGDWEWQWVTKWVSINYPSDGLLPEYTQIMQDNPTPNNVYRVDSANHLEVTDMSNSPQGDLTRIQFNNIFDRPSGDFFRID